MPLWGWHGCSVFLAVMRIRLNVTWGRSEQFLKQNTISASLGATSTAPTDLAQTPAMIFAPLVLTPLWGWHGCSVFPAMMRKRLNVTWGRSEQFLKQNTISASLWAKSTAPTDLAQRRPWFLLPWCWLHYEVDMVAQFSPAVIKVIFSKYSKHWYN